MTALLMGRFEGFCILQGELRGFFNWDRTTRVWVDSQSNVKGRTNIKILYNLALRSHTALEASFEKR
jgi:hypothetical protein